MDRKKWQTSTPTPEALRKGYDNRGKYPDNDNRKYIFNAIGSKKVWKVTDKSHKIRLLPSYPNDNINFYGMIVYIHTNVGVNNNQYLCLKKMKNQKCPICEQQVVLWDTEPEMAKDLYPQTRYLVWVIDLSIEKEKQNSLIWSCPKTAMDDILGISYKKSTDEILNLSNVDDGIAIYFDREKKGQTSFSQYKNFQLDDKVTVVKDEWLEAICSFEEVLHYATYDEIQSDFLGTEISQKEVVSAVVEIPKIDETVQTEVVSTAENLSVDDMDRDQLEELAKEVLSNDYDDNEIEDMGTKKLKRLLKEVAKVEVEENIETVITPEPSKKVEVSKEESAREVLRKKLQERIK